MELEVRIPADSKELEGSLALPENASSIVIFAHGSGSSRHSPRNRYVAAQLHSAGIGTLLFDLLTSIEDENYDNRFDIGLLTERLIVATRWFMQRPEARGLALGYFGASTGSAAAIGAAAELVDDIGAIVSRGGRPDLALGSIGRFTAPILLIVGSLDDVVIELNRQAYELVIAEKELAVVEGATHLFEEPGKLEEVAALASQWFSRHLTAR